MVILGRDDIIERVERRIGVKERVWEGDRFRVYCGERIRGYVFWRGRWDSVVIGE